MGNWWLVRFKMHQLIVSAGEGLGGGPKRSMYEYDQQSLSCYLTDNRVLAVGCAKAELIKPPEYGHESVADIRRAPAIRCSFFNLSVKKNPIKTTNKNHHQPELVSPTHTSGALLVSCVTLAISRSIKPNESSTDTFTKSYIF